MGRILAEAKQDILQRLHPQCASRVCSVISPRGAGARPTQFLLWAAEPLRDVSKELAGETECPLEPLCSR